MKKLLLIVLLSITFLHMTKQDSYAVVDPLSVPNNKFGITILFPAELQEAAKLVDTNGGSWGYVIIPIQAGDKDMKKWQDFLDQANVLHVIPIFRLATEGDYFNTKVWRKPNDIDVVDFANFLNSLIWHTKNRYIVVFNEPNDGAEWDGTPNPQEYAQILSFAFTAFKSRSQDFFIISAGLDNAAANTTTAMNEYVFLEQMDQAVPGIFNQIDGLGSHSYANPGFSQPPQVISPESIASFSYEESLVHSLINKDLPVFITETGWTQNVLPQSVIAQYFTYAFQSVWSNKNVVAVTPFLLQARAGPFQQFSLIAPDGSENLLYQTLQEIPKASGSPVLVPQVLAAVYTPKKKTQTMFFSKTTTNSDILLVSSPVKKILKWFLRI